MLDDYDILRFSILLVFIGLLNILIGHPVIGGLLIFYAAYTVLNLRRDD